MLSRLSVLQTAHVKPTDPHRLQREGVRWELEASFVPRLEAVLSAPARVVKESPAKLVTVCEVAGSDYYLKRYRYGSGLARRLKYFFKRSPARQEWELARLLEDRGIPAVRHLALGQRWGRLGLLESILITEGFPGQPIGDLTPETATALLAFVERMHDAGVVQKDLHGANLLRSPATGEIRLVDLYGTSLKSRLSPAERDRNLAVLRATVPVPVSPAVEALSRPIRRAMLAHRSKRVWKHNREFAPRRVRGVDWQMRLPGWTRAMERVLQQPDDWLASEARPLKTGRSSTVGGGSGLVLKRYNVTKPFNLVKDLFRPSRAARAFRLAYHLELLGMSTPRPLAAGHRRRFGCVTSSYFLMEEISGARRLDQWEGNPEEALAAVARLVARLHLEGFYHRDLKSSNLLLDARGQVFLIDLEGLRYVGEVSTERALADLERLWRSARGHPQFRPRFVARFFGHYRRAQRRGPHSVLNCQGVSPVK